MGVAATMAAIVARPPSIALLGKQTQRHRWVLGPLAFSSISSSSNSSSKARKLVLYSKPGCCLCDGLKEKLQAAFLLSGSESLHDVDLQVRDITTHPDWENAYQYEIPVLARLLSDGTEIISAAWSGANPKEDIIRIERMTGFTAIKIQDCTSGVGICCILFQLLSD